MHATDLIHANLGVACQSIHRTRFNALLTAVAAALAGQTTSVTGLGRLSPRQITEKANIKQMDRLVGHPRMHGDAQTVYQAMVHWLFGQEERPVIVTDAGFKKPWFRAVEALRWDWVGRARGPVQMTRPGETPWLNTRKLGGLPPPFLEGRRSPNG